MVRVAKIIAGKVVNVTVKETFTPAEDLIDVTGITCGPGYLYDGVSFTTPPPSPEELEAQAEAEQKTQTKADVMFANIINATPAQIDTYIQNNVTDLASAKNVLKLLTKIVVVLASREFKD